MCILLIGALEQVQRLFEQCRSFKGPQSFFFFFTADKNLSLQARRRMSFLTLLLTLPFAETCADAEVSPL